MQIFYNDRTNDFKLSSYQQMKIIKLFELVLKIKNILKLLKEYGDAGMESRASYMQSMRSTTELHPR